MAGTPGQQSVLRLDGLGGRRRSVVEQVATVRVRSSGTRAER